MTCVAILQSNYIPWKGYFDLINSVDRFVIFDDVQYTRRDWRNRNKIKTANGLEWLTIPVKVKGRFIQRIDETVVSDNNWTKLHWKKITQSYVKSEYFDECKQWLLPIYQQVEGLKLLSDINKVFIQAFNAKLDIETELLSSSDLFFADEKNKRLLGICQQLGATVYVSGPAARNYLDVASFERQGIQVKWMNYRHYPEYRQLYPPFDHGVSMIDLFMNEGTQAKKYMFSCQ